MRHSIWVYLKRYPPVACRVMARTSGRHPVALTDRQLSDASGLSLATIEHLSWETSWDSVPVGLCRRFMAACNMDPSNFNQMRRANQYSSKRLLTKVSYLKRSNEWKRYSAMLSTWKESLQRQSHR